MMQISMLDETLVHKEKLLAAGLLGKLRLDDIAVDADTFRLLSHWKELLLVVAPEEAHDALLEVTRIEMIQLLAVAVEREAYFRIHQRDSGELLHDMAQFGLGRLEEVASGRHVEKQVFHREGRARLHRHQRLFFDDRAFVDDLHPYFVLLTSRLQLHLRDGGNASQGLATETHGTNGEQVLRLADLGGGMTFKAHTGVGFRHATAIVDNHNHRLAGVFHHQIDLRGSSIQCILHQLFHSRCRSLDHLARRNLVGNAIG